MKDLFELIARVAIVDSSILITGETGTGKGLVARAIHGLSERARAPFLVANCPALPKQLIEAELFGHVAGAFTDARDERTGLILSCAGGTILLDEIGDMPRMLQPKLLRALQDRCVRPVGGDRELPFDVRILAATNCDLQARVAEGRFRSDLFFRLNVITLRLPPLRLRGDDILILARFFIEHFAVRHRRGVKGLSNEAAEALFRYDWPGNVRELENCIERAVVLTSHQRIEAEDLPEHVREEKRILVAEAPTESCEMQSLKQVEHRHICVVLNACSGNHTVAARILGIDRKTLYRKLKELG